MKQIRVEIEIAIADGGEGLLSFVGRNGQGSLRGHWFHNTKGGL